MAAAASLWSLSGTEPAHQRFRSELPAIAATAAHIVPAAAPLAAPVRAAWPRAGDLSAAVSGLAALWTAGVLVPAVRMGGGLLLAGRIRGHAVAVRSSQLHEAGRTLALRLGIGRPLPLLESSEIEAPVTLVRRRPVDRIRRLWEGDPMSRPRAWWTLAVAAAMAATASAGTSLLSLSRVHAAAAAMAATPTAASWETFSTESRGTLTHLIIDPVDKNDWRAKRIVALGC